MKQLNSHNFKEVYQWLGIDLNKLSCLMLDTEPIKLPTYITQDWETGAGVNWDKLFLEEYMYFAKNKDRFWINGFVGDTPHATLLYGFMTEAINYKTHIEAVLNGWEMKTVKIADVGYFDSPYEDEEYYCLVAHLEVTDELLEGHRRLEFLPHINTFTGYKPHITIAYMKKDEKSRDFFIEDLKKQLVGKELKINQLNYGGNK